MPDWIPREWTMQMAYALCAVAGGLIVLLQLGLGLMGAGGDEVDLELDLETDAGLHLFSVRTVSAFLTVFGLVGWIGTLEGWPRGITFTASFLSGSSVLMVVAVLLKMQRRLHSSGNMEAGSAVGTLARVYLSIPGGGKGNGKITVVAQGRTNEYPAFTRGKALPMGTTVRVLRMTAPGTFEVAELEENEA